MRVEADISVSAKDLNSFMLHHNYAGFQGKLSVILGLLAFVAAALTYGNVERMYTFAYVAFGFVLLIYTPISINMRSKKQFLLTPIFKEGIHYIIDEEGITTVIREESATVLWKEVFKVVITPSYIYVYTTRVNAAILPKTQLGEKWYEVVEIIKNSEVAPRTKFK